MKLNNHLLFFLCLLGLNTSTFAQQKSSTTFVVDANLPAPQKTLKAIGGKDMETTILHENNATNANKEIWASSFRNDSLCYGGSAPFYYCLVEAYADHRSLVLSPDMIWMLISQGFCYHVNENAEALMDKIVSHEGKKQLVVTTKGKDLKWDEVVNSFETQIESNTKDKIAKVLTADFTTTGNTEKIASGITLMSTMRQYFDYTVIRLSCGIPSITLEGTTEDWKKVVKKTEALRKYGLGWWVDDLRPILDQFVAASKGNIDRDFWRNIVNKDLADRLAGGRCSSEKPTILNGWFLKLMPFSKDGRTPDSVPHTYDKISSQMTYANLILKDVDLDGTLLKETPMELWGGFVGYDKDSITGALRPRIGWLIREADTDEEQINALISNGNNTLHVSAIPDILKKARFIPKIELSFNGNVAIPEWFDSVRIDRIYIYNELNEEQIEQLKNRFPDREMEISKNSGGVKSIKIEVPKGYDPEDFVYGHSSVSPDGLSSWTEYEDNITFISGEKLKKHVSRFKTNVLHKLPSEQNEEFFKKNHIHRTNSVSFIIEKDGSISDLKISDKIKDTEKVELIKKFFKELPRITPLTDKYGYTIRYKMICWI
ncbi:MAG: DUF4419 domain-containing protein [Bacteroidaceae bacterium]|nr:DUF4419 domain-containing protein [Bacteroidaceae bacterium]